MAGFATAFVLAVAIVLRIAVARATRAALSVDSWFWRAYVETCRREGRFPPALPQYLLDEEQWYPPLFPWLLVRIPGLPRVERHLGLGLDVLRLALLMAAAAWLGGGDARVVVAGGLVYATTPVLVLYNVQPNPRALGAFFLDALVLLQLGMGTGVAPAGTWIAVGVLGGLVLLSHKMTAQLLWFGAAAGALAVGDLRLLALVPLSVAAAWLLSGGFYAKVLRAHADIVAFWNRNWRWLQADPIRESPVYGEPGFRTPGLFHQPGWRGVLRLGAGLVRLAPGIWVAVALAGAFGLRSGGTRSEVAAASVWLLLTVSFAALTTWVPILKCLGAGSLYLYNAAFPAALLLGLAVGASGAWAPGLVALVLAVNVAALAFFLWRQRSVPARDDPGWEALVVHLKAADRGPVLCLPQNLYDELAYRTGQPVLFGAHGYGFRRVEPFFPRLQLSFAEMRERYGARYVVAREGALNDKAAADLPRDARAFGRYRLFEI
jgi:hypothetical protein